MPETIAMTPGGEVEWERHATERGDLYLPRGGDVGELINIIDDPEYVEDLPVLGTGSSQKAVSATTYSCGEADQYALRVIDSNSRLGRGQNGLDWLVANLTLSQALTITDLADSPLYFLDNELPNGILTPKYFGFLASGDYDYYLMSNESEGRRLASMTDERLTNRITDYESDLIFKLYGGEVRSSIFLDYSAPNFLFGHGDVVHLDVSANNLLADDWL